MITVNDVYKCLASFAPVEMKMDSDNVGLLVGCVDANVSKILVSLDITNDVISEALDTGAELIVSHHPLFFSLNSITDADRTGRKVIRLISGGIAAICMHTNLDAAIGGTNDALAATVGIACDGEYAQLLSEDGFQQTGQAYSYGRVGCLKSPLPFDEYLAVLKLALNTGGLRYHNAGRDVYKIAVVGGSGGSELHHALRHGCDTFITADIKYDVFLEAKEAGINIIDGDHFCTENLVVPAIGDKLSAALPGATVLMSKMHVQTARFF